MRGRPWIRIMLVCLGVILMGLPVWRLTGSPLRSEPVSQVQPGEVKSLDISLAFAHPPESFQLTYLGKSVLSGSGPKSEFNGTWSGALTKDGVDLLLKVKWPKDTPRTAVEVKVENSGNVLTDHSWWGTDDLTELVTVPSP